MSAAARKAGKQSAAEAAYAISAMEAGSRSEIPPSVSGN